MRSRRRLNENVQLLDSTRIHPETYIWATKMAIDALEYDDDEDDSNVKQRALEEIMEDPEKLRDLDLDAFAIELERQVSGTASVHLAAIVTPRR